MNANKKEIILEAGIGAAGIIGAVFAAYGLVNSSIVPTVVGVAVCMIAFSSLTVIRKRRETRISNLELSTSRATKAIAEETNHRLSLLNPIVRNIAGSVGRAAPLIRENHKKLSRVAREIELPAQVVDRSASSTPSRNGTSATESKPTPVEAARQVAAESNGNPHKLPSAPVRERRSKTRQLRTMIIADEFTLQAFKYEWNQVEVTPTNWRKTLDNDHFDLLFVESAWEGNGGEWRYHFTGGSAPRPAVIELVDECKSRGIPTVFWNKEDPPHYSDFLETAKLFDFIFTTDQNMLPRYAEDAPDSVVNVLPFAAQPAIHNPARIGLMHRTESIVFGGMYFRHKYPERRHQMDFILPAAANFGLDIYSRQLGGSQNYQFPEGLTSQVVGSLEYSKMLSAYHKYKVVVNVNSVVDSPSMCARRIFEATASGAAVVSSSSPAIETFYPRGLITEVHDSTEANVAFKTLLRSPEYIDRKVHLAQRHTWENHTYTHRVGAIAETVDISIENLDKSVSVISPTNRPHMIGQIMENFSRQSYPEKELLVLTHGFEISQFVLSELKERFDLSDVRVISADKSSTLGANLNRLIGESQGAIVARMDDDDWYGENYLRDMVNSLIISGAELAGKAASYIYFESTNQTILTYSAKEKMFTDFVRGATTVAYRDLFDAYSFHDANQSEDSDLLSRLKSDSVAVYAGDRFNFSVFRSRDLNAHTWREADAALFASGELKFMGPAYDQISI